MSQIAPGEAPKESSKEASRTVIAQNEAMLNALPFTHVYGVLAHNVANQWGLTTVLMRQFDPTKVLEAIEVLKAMDRLEIARCPRARRRRSWQRNGASCSSPTVCQTGACTKLPCSPRW